MISSAGAKLAPFIVAPAQKVRLMYGPSNPVSISQHISKYRIDAAESFLDMCNRLSGALGDNEDHRRDIRMTFLHQNFMAAGRVQRAVGAPMRICAHNCFVSGTIKDDSTDIMEKVKEAFLTMRMGGGIGYDFSTLRWRGAHIKSLNSTASGAVSFMEVFNASCKTVRSAGGRRGAQMGVLRCDHPDIEEFINAKTAALAEDVQKAQMLMSMAVDAEGLPMFDVAQRAIVMDIVEKVSIQNRLAAFNVSVAVTDEFMEAVRTCSSFDLIFGGNVVRTVDAVALWNKIMRATWDWAEPGVLFIDRINDANNLWYCEVIAATNPCGEQPLPPYGACLLGSFAMPKYVRKTRTGYGIDYEALKADIPGIVRAMDNVIDTALYPLPQQEKEAKDKRRMGLGVTGMANAIEACGHPYGSAGYLAIQGEILTVLRDESYRASALLAAEKGAFPLFDAEKYLKGEFIQTLPDHVRSLIAQFGIRNSHLLSIAPTGTISLTADNMSSGIEPVFAYKNGREIVNDDGVTKQYVEIDDYGLREFGVRGRRADDLHVMEHVEVYTHAQQFIDSSISKTCNVGSDVTFEQFKDVYMTAWEKGAKGCTTFRLDGKRFGMMKSLDKVVPAGEIEVTEGAACFIDPKTGVKTCDE